MEGLKIRREPVGWEVEMQCEKLKRTTVGWAKVYIYSSSLDTKISDT